MGIGENVGEAVGENTGQSGFRAANSNGDIYFQDNFDTGSLATSQNGIYWGSPGSGLSVTTNNPRSGSYSLENNFTAPTPTAPINEIRIYFEFNSAYKEVWIQYYVFVEDNWSYTGDGGDNNKFFIAHTYGDGRNSWNVDEGVPSNSFDYIKYNVEHRVAGTNIDYWRPEARYAGRWDDTSQTTSINNSEHCITNNKENITSNTWHRIRFHIKLGTKNGSLNTDGIFRFWINSNLVYDGLNLGSQACTTGPDDDGNGPHGVTTTSLHNVMDFIYFWGAGKSSLNNDSRTWLDDLVIASSEDALP